MLPRLAVLSVIASYYSISTYFKVATKVAKSVRDRGNGATSQMVPTLIRPVGARGYARVMGRPSRFVPGGYVYHVRARTADRRPLFRDEADYAAFETVLRDAADVRPVRLVSYCLMPDHWHLVVWPAADGALSGYVHWLTATHARRNRVRPGAAGTGRRYRGRFRSFPVQEGPPVWAVCRYAEGNPVRAGLVKSADEWRWSSLWHAARGRPGWLSDGPWGRPALAPWLEWVNRPPPEAELAALRRCAERGAPYGDAAWVAATAERLGLQSTLRAPGRPRTRARRPARAPRPTPAAKPPGAAGPKRPVRGVNLFSLEELIERMGGLPGEKGASK
jgi:putative transposase